MRPNNQLGEWIIRCPDCGRWKDARAAGIVRIHARSVGKRVLGMCSDCGRMRWLRVERVEDLLEAAQAIERMSADLEAGRVGSA